MSSDRIETKTDWWNAKVRADCGGEAFPSNWSDGSSTPGMTLRDYFAASAMQGMIADPNGCGSVGTIAKCAYEYADAMLKAREANHD